MPVTFPACYGSAGTNGRPGGAALTEADAGRPFRCGGWEGVVVHSPEAAGDGPPKVMAMMVANSVAMGSSTSRLHHSYCRIN